MALNGTTLLSFPAASLVLVKASDKCALSQPKTQQAPARVCKHSGRQVQDLHDRQPAQAASAIAERSDARSPGSQRQEATTPGHTDARGIVPVRVAFRPFNSVGTRDQEPFAAQWLACALPYRRFARTLAGTGARLGADADRYSFTVRDLHPLLLAGFAGALRNPSHKYLRRGHTGMEVPPQQQSGTAVVVGRVLRPRCPSEASVTDAKMTQSVADNYALVMPSLATQQAQLKLLVIAFRAPIRRQSDHGQSLA